MSIVAQELLLIMQQYVKRIEKINKQLKKSNRARASFSIRQKNGTSEKSREAANQRLLAVFNS